MFSGVIRHRGLLRVISHDSVTGNDDSLKVEIESTLFLEDLKVGDSVAVQGVCLTIEYLERESSDAGTSPLGRAGFFLSAETLRRSTFGLMLKDGLMEKSVHLEPSLKIGSTMDGHFVYGHVDTSCRIISIKEEGESWKFVFSVNQSLYPYLALKGSVSLDGVSLTIGESELRDSEVVFSVYIIPHTFNETSFSSYQEGTCLNLEIDPFARYAVHAARYQMSTIA